MSTLYGMELSAFEEQLYLRAGSTAEIDAFRRSSILTGVLFSLLFSCAACLVGEVFQIAWIAVALILYSLANLWVFHTFARVLGGYRSLAEKLADRLAGCAVISVDELAPLRLVAENAGLEHGLRVRAVLLTAFYVCGVLASYWVIPVQYRSLALAVFTVFLILLSLALKLLLANAIIKRKRLLYENGTRLAEAIDKP